MKKVLLLNPVTKTGGTVLRAERCQQKIFPGMALWPPISLAYVAAVIESLNLKISFLDAEIENLSYSSMIEQILQLQPDIILIQGITPSVYDDNELVEIIKNKLPNVIAVIYGSHSTARPEDYITKNFDFAILGEPEMTFKNLVEKLYFNEKINLNEIPGLAYLKEGEMQINTRTNTTINLDSFPFPARQYIKNNLYIMPGLNEVFTVLKISRGCPYQCIYCTSRLYYGPHCRLRSPENIYQEIEDVIKTYKIRTFLFHSDTFNINKSYLLKLLDYIIESNLNIKWLSNSRTELLDEELVKKMKEAGCYAVSLGIESGSDVILKNIKKGNKTEDAIKAVNLLKKYKINSIGYFMLGLPGETKETIQQTINFMLQLNPDYIQVYLATPFPGTEFFDIAIKNNWIKELRWDRLYNGITDIIEYPDITNKMLSYYQKLAYFKFYFRFHRIIKEISKISSLKILKNYIRTLLNFIIIFFKK